MFTMQASNKLAKIYAAILIVFILSSATASDPSETSNINEVSEQPQPTATTETTTEKYYKDVFHTGYLDFEDCPFIAFIFNREFDKSSPGTVLTKKLVLANAARGNKKVGGFFVRVGSSHPEYGGSIYEVKRVHLHPEYDSVELNIKGFAFPNIAILELEKEITDERVKPVELVNKSFEFSSRGHIITWVQKPNPVIGPADWVLWSYYADLLTRVDCLKKFGYFIDPRSEQFCAMFERLNYKCDRQHFYGAPLLNYENKQFGIIIGYLKFDPKVCDRFPMIFTGIAPSRDWIDEVIASVKTDVQKTEETNGTDYMKYIIGVFIVLCSVLSLWIFRRKLLKLISR